MIRAVLFDVGGVLTPPLQDVVLPAVLASGVDIAPMRTVLMPMFASATDGDEPAHRWERGEIDLEEFVALVGPAGAGVRALLDPALPGFVLRDFGPHEQMQAFVAEVRGRGVRTAVVSNTVPEWLPAWRRALPRPDLFDELVFSCEVGLRKPNAAIYRLAVERLGVEPDEALLLDDFAPMVAGALAAGLQAIEVRDHADAIEATRRLLDR